MRTYVPLNERSPAEIRAQAALYEEMAASARTPEVKLGLEKLARRFVALADQRGETEARDRRQLSAQELANAAD